MKNLVMGVATGYDWYKIEPFVTSFNRYVKNADLVLFVDNISYFTLDALYRGGVEMLPFNPENKYSNLVNSRFYVYKNFLNERGENYHQVLLTDVRDVIFQGDVFKRNSDIQSYFSYVTEGEFIKNAQLNYNWIKNLFGKEEADKLSEYEIICAGTILGTVDSIKIFLNKLTNLLRNQVRIGDDQAAENYLVHEKLLEIKNIVESNCQSGNILTAGCFFMKNPINIKDDKILRGDGKIPAVVHQYDRHSILVQLVDKLYRDKKFQFNENFNDPRSIFEQLFYLATLGKMDDIYKIFTKYLHGKNFVGYADNLTNLWEIILQKNITPTSELLMLSIQTALMSTSGNGFHFGHINQILSFANFCIKNHLVVSYPFKMFLGNILFNLANQMYDSEHFDPCINCLNFMVELEIPLDQNFYLFKAKICRETGRKSEALSAYEKALNF